MEAWIHLKTHRFNWSRWSKWLCLWHLSPAPGCTNALEAGLEPHMTPLGLAESKKMQKELLGLQWGTWKTDEDSTVI